MFEALSNRFSKIFSSLSKKRNLNENNISEALAEIKTAFLASDVSFEVTQNFIEEIKNECIGQRIFQNVEPGQQVVKIVHDKLIDILGGNEQSNNLSAQRPLCIMMVGLQGSGKTTTSAKLALWLKNKQEKPALVACDIYRPAAIEQLKTLGSQINIPVFSYGQIPVNEIAKNALKDAKDAGCSVIIFDTAGRLQIDQKLINEVKLLKEYIQPQESLLVIDSALGQEAVNVSKTFHEALNLTGVILTKLDGDAKGGAALSMKRSVGLPIKFSGIGEKMDEFEKFHPDRMASRILGMGDIVSLVEKAQEEMDPTTIDQLSQRLISGNFNFEDFRLQIQQMKKMGSQTSLAKWLPNIPLFQTANVFDDEIKRCEAFLSSMTPQERQNPHLLNSSYRRARITKGSGLNISDFNKFIKHFQKMKKMSQKIRKMDIKKLKETMGSLSGNSNFLSNFNQMLKK